MTNEEIISSYQKQIADLKNENDQLHKALKTAQDLLKTAQDLLNKAQLHFMIIDELFGKKELED